MGKLQSDMSAIAQNASSLIPLKLSRNAAVNVAFGLAEGPDRFDRYAELTAYDIGVEVPPDDPFITYDASDMDCLRFCGLLQSRPAQCGDLLRVTLDDRTYCHWLGNALRCEFTMRVSSIDVAFACDALTRYVIKGRLRDYELITR